jgi:hypothetical protein
MGGSTRIRGIDSGRQIKKCNYYSQYKSGLTAFVQQTFPYPKYSLDVLGVMVTNT